MRASRTPTAIGRSVRLPPGGGYAFGMARPGEWHIGLDESFAKFFSKVAMLAIFPFREISCES